MIGLDTNLLVRYVTADDLEQWQLAAELIEAEGQLCFLSNIVLCELVWVLRGQLYQFTRPQIAEVLEAMLATPVMEFENRSSVYQALQRMKLVKLIFLITRLAQLLNKLSVLLLILLTVS
ncbi:PIN domain-containing protein [Chlorogloea sp. CCALA 695]|uniref:PIN domain-containing protein n=1 Tax=Chlorogloea sp. CCALA 695 TaxID=2107693 RepID=UPI001E3510BE|nr:type II toxin-antitoxin system VapC family toxin [Chlorogloea sp. CCALA 695]